MALKDWNLEASEEAGMIQIQNVQCDKAANCLSSCWHKEQHDVITECDFPCPLNPGVVCIKGD